LQKYQFELKDCSHIFSCHKEAGISLVKSTKASNSLYQRAADYTSCPLLI
jgi:hypothetical protein